MKKEDNTEIFTQSETRKEMLQKKYQMRSDFVLREIAGEYMIIATDSDHAFSNSIMVPNETAVFLWKAFQQPATIEEVVEKVMQLYEGEEEQIRGSVWNFVKQSLENRVLEEVV